ncbi:MAG: DUF3619 family protein [Pseudomonadota bacterium]
MSYTRQHQADILQDRIGMKVAAHLSAGADALPYEISERLRAARTQALAQRKRAVMATRPVLIAAGGTAVLGGDDSGWGLWGRLAAALPVMALVVGMVVINVVQDDNRANELAEIDVALLTDDLPPSAYADPGFLQFLRRGPVSDQPTAEQ